MLEEVQTLGELRRVVASEGLGDRDQKERDQETKGTREQGTEGEREQGNEGARERGEQGPAGRETRSEKSDPESGAAPQELPRPHFLYPEWPWWKPFQWIRVAFIEAVMRPLTWLLGAPRVVGPAKPLPEGPLLIVANHVTDVRRAADSVRAAPGHTAGAVATAMAGDMLDDFRHWRNP